jgi:hypothetical protein
MFAQSYQFRLINRSENALRTYRVRPTASVLPETFRRVAGKELLKFLRNSHRETMQRSGRVTSRTNIQGAAAWAAAECCDGWEAVIP